ncbi:UNVERIFIED_ORG: hypothetical protein J2X79_002533 [Arthrobacter globiformis]|nr:hypothetical protein [Arthrobacter globiformis]
MRNNSVKDVCIAVCDGIKGLPKAITTVWERGAGPARDVRRWPRTSTGRRARGHGDIGDDRILAALEVTDPAFVQALVPGMTARSDL